MLSRVKIFGLSAAIAGFALGSISAMAADPIIIKYASPYTPTHVFGKADLDFFAKVEKDSGGKVKFQPYWAKSLITDREGMEQLSAGVADAAHIVPVYSRVGKDLTRSSAGWFDSRLTPDQKVDVFWKVWNKYPEVRKEYTDVHLVAAHAGDAMHVLTVKQPVRSIGDLKGLRLKATGDTVKVLNSFGAAAVAMPMGDVYVSLQKGILDGAIAPYETLISLKFGDHVKYYSKLPNPRSAYGSRAFDKEAWDKLPADIQKVITDNSAYWSQRIHYQARALDLKAIGFAKEKGIEIIDPPAAETERFVAAQEKIFVAQAKKLDKKGLPGSAIYGDIQAWSQSLLKAK